MESKTITQPPASSPPRPAQPQDLPFEQLAAEGEFFDDIVDFAASLMEWRYVRHVPVEDDAGRLLGLEEELPRVHDAVLRRREDEGEGALRGGVHELHVLVLREREVLAQLVGA